MPVFNVEGTKWFHHWTVDGDKDFAVVPEGTIRGFDTDLPIRLLNGRSHQFGKTHIEFKRAGWAKSLNKSIPELVYEKLGQSAQIYCTENDSKIKFYMPIAPESLMVLNHNTCREGIPYLSITTMYNPRGTNNIDGDLIGRYSSQYRIDRHKKAPK